MTDKPTTEQATIHEGVQYTPGDGAAITIRPGPAEITREVDSATLSWTNHDNTVGSAAMPKSQFDRYVKNGQIVVGASS